VITRPLLVAALLAAAFTTASFAQPEEENLSRWKANMARHQLVAMRGVPAPYAEMRDPTPDSDAKLKRGTMVFDRTCSSCHGWSGRGNGPEGFFLVPVPADLEWLTGQPKDRAEPYIYWSIAEGGTRFQSEMPAFKDKLSKEDIWALTAYLRAGMPYKNP